MTQVLLIGLPVLMLLSMDTLSARTPGPEAEFLAGNRTIFGTSGHSKAKGVSLTIAYPNSWAAVEGDRPNIVQKFVSQGGRGLETVMIVTKELSLPKGMVLSNKDRKELLSPSELRGMLPAEAKAIEALSTEIEGEPAGVLEYSVRGERAGVTLSTHGRVLAFFSANTLVQVHFQVAGPASSEGEVARRMAIFKPLFALMANSIVLQDKWMGVLPDNVWTLEENAALAG